LITTGAFATALARPWTAAELGRFTGALAAGDPCCSVYELVMSGRS
jgi:hypothetical protein